MPDVFLQGIPVYQHDKVHITGAISVKDLIKIHHVDIWKAGLPLDKQGCQREPIKAHYRKLGGQLKRDKDIILPTSIIMSGNEEKEDQFTIRVEHNVQYNLMTVRIPEGHKLKIVDGQHRVLALEYAINALNSPAYLDFQLPYVLIFPKNRVEEIRTFYEINTKGKKVSTDLALQLLNDWNKQAEDGVSKAEHSKIVALNAAIALNENPDSVWYNMITMGNSNKEGMVKSVAFVTSLSPFLHTTGFIRKEWQEASDLVAAGRKIAGLLNNFWDALRIILPEQFPPTLESKRDWVIQSTAGMSIWHYALQYILEECMLKREKITDFSPENIVKFLREYSALPFEDPVLIWQAENKKLDIDGGEFSYASSNKTYKHFASQIKDEIESKYLYGANSEEMKITY